MGDKLILGLPDDGQASVAPANRFRLAEDDELGNSNGKGPSRGADRRLYSLPLLFGTLGVILGSSEQEDAAPATPQRNTSDAGPRIAGTNGNLAAIEDVAAFLREMTDELMASTANFARGRHVASVRLSFEDTPLSRSPNLADTVLRSYNANDNEGRINISGESFRFPPSAVVRSGRQPVGQSGSGGGHQPDDDDDEDRDHHEERANRLPVSLGRNILASGMVNLSTLIFLDDLLAKTSDPDGDKLDVRNLVVSSGTITAYGDGIWLYTPERGFGGNVTFTYQVSDGKGNIVTQSVMSLLKAPPHEVDGSEADDRLLGTPGDDLVTAKGGDDFVYSREGRDIIFAGDGDDTVFGGDGDDLIHGEAGNDRLFGGGGNDVLFGGAGNDHLHGEDGNDSLMGEAGNDRLYGGAGNDRLFGEAGNDTLLGEAGDDLLDGGDGNDDLAGGAGKDVALGGAGDDRFRAGLVEEDTRQMMVAAGTVLGDGDDTYVGGEGDDTYDASAAAGGVVVDLAAGTATGAAIGTDSLAEIENVEGSAFDDTIAGDDGDNTLEGGAGNDRLSGGGGDDTVRGNDGDDTVIVTVIGNADVDDGNDIYDGGDGYDTLDLSALVKAVIADIEAGYTESEEIGRDTILGFETIHGGRGDDRFSGGSGDDILYGGAGDDRLDGRSGDDHLVGGDGNDRLYGSTGNDVFLVIAHMDGDTDGNDEIDGGSGNDVYDASATIAGVVIDLELGTASSSEIGNDVLKSVENAIGGRGDDVLVASISVNVLTGNDGDDVFVFHSVAAARNDGNGWDEITDFQVGDRLDLSAFAGQAGTLMFAGLELDGASPQIGRVSFFYEALGDDTRTVVRTIVDLDHDDDIQILLRGHHELTQQDFILAALDGGTQDAVNQA